VGHVRSGEVRSVQDMSGQRTARLIQVRSSQANVSSGQIRLVDAKVRSRQNMSGQVR